MRINQDWSKIISIAEDLISKSRTRYSEIVPYGNATFYHIGLLGSVSHHHISENWHNVSGIWINKYIPWIKQMEKDMVELEPTYQMSIMNGNGAEHVDFPNLPTALNYPIETTDAISYVLVDGMEHTYPSIADQPWLLNTQYPHGVRNTQYRLVFNMHFGRPYDVVKSWFNAHPALVYG